MMRTTVQLSLFAILLLAATTANSQSNYASLSGTVSDPQQQVVPGCTVQLSSVSTNSSRQATTNELGIFQISGLLPGNYVLSVSASGFGAVSQPITLEVGQARTVDFTLKVAAVNTSVVDVKTDSGSLLKTTDASVGEVVEPAAVQNLPLNGRMLIDLVLTVPGAHEAHGAQAGDMSPLYWRPGQRSALSIAGNRPNANYFLLDGATWSSIGVHWRQQGFPEGLNHSNKLRFAPRVGISHNLHKHGLVLHAAFGIFFTPVDMNTWCNQRHNVPFVFPETQQSDNFIPAPGIVANHFNFGPAVLGTTTVSFAAFEFNAPPQYIEQWSASVEKSVGAETTLELGYLGSHGLHLQRSRLINNAPPGPGAIGPRRPFTTLNFIPGSVLPDNITIANTTFPVSGINLLENSAQSSYHAGYVNVRRRFTRGLTFLSNYTFSKNLSDAPDFRSPMFESALPQNSFDLRPEKGLACDVRHRFAFSADYDLPALGKSKGFAHAITREWRLSAVYQAQSGFPFTISVFGDTANAGTLLGENPIRANHTGQPVFDANSRTADRWFNTAAFSTPAAFTFGNAGRNTVYGPGRQTLDIALQREFAMTETVKLQFRAEAFNALNHTNLGTPNRFVNTPQFGTITEAATPGREIQLGVRLSF